MRIVHVTNRYVGGVKTAIENLVNSSPEHEHYLVFISKEGEFKTALDSAKFKSVQVLEFTNPIKLASLIRKMSSSWEANVIHAHSSWAGLYTRILRQKVIVLYQPHGIAFANPKYGPIPRLALNFVEYLLSFRTTAFLAVGSYEMEIIKSMSPKAPVFLLRNWSRLERKNWKTNPTQNSRVIGVVGRICLEKDPEYFIQVAHCLRAISSKYTFRWLGAGDADLTARLQGEEIGVTGWLSELEVARELANLDFLVSSSKSEGMPFTLLDALNTGIPAFLRDIPAFTFENLPTYATPMDLALAIHSFDLTTNENYLKLFQSFRELSAKESLVGHYANLLLRISQQGNRK
jgi:glycosyltransferase involved in cell wall biosynthesis